MTDTGECGLCAQLHELPTDAVVLRTGDWAVYVNPSYPGQECVWVQAVSHVEGPWALSDAQAGSFGVVMRAAATGLREARGAERVYVISMGENHQHFHALLIARRADISPEGRGLTLVGTILGAKGAPDRVAAAAMAADIRSRVPTSSQG